MADITLDLLLGGFNQLNYHHFTLELNNERIAKGLLPVDQSTSEQIWRTVVLWYMQHWNPPELKRKTQKAHNNRIRQVPKPHLYGNMNENIANRCQDQQVF